jgi:hypothetical protein
MFLTAGLPPPPTNYKFRPITIGDTEAAMRITLLSGRYYPGILSSELLTEDVKAAVAEMAGKGAPNQTPDDGYRLWALEGLTGGHFNSVDPREFHKKRSEQVRQADTLGRRALKDWIDRKRGADPMKVEEEEVDVDTMPQFAPLDTTQAMDVDLPSQVSAVQL